MGQNDKLRAHLEPYQVRYGSRVHKGNCVDAYRAVGVNRDVRGQAANDVKLANAAKGMLKALVDLVSQCLEVEGDKLPKWNNAVRAAQKAIKDAKP